MKSIVTVIICTFIASNALFAQAKKVTISKYNVAFTIKNVGLKVNGNFGSGGVDINYDAANPEKSSFNGTVKVSTISTKMDARDTHLKKADFFDATKYPTITMQSTKITKSGNGYIGTFNLTIKGISKVVTAPIVMAKAGDGTLTFGTNFKVNRMDFGVGGSSVTMADVLDVKISASGK